MAILTHASLPADIQAGDTLQVTVSLPEYLPANNWVLYYVLSGGGNTYKLTSTTSGTSHAIVESAATTGKWKSGEYVFQKYVENTSGERRTIGVGSTRILPHIAEQDPDIDQWRQIHSHARDGLVELAKGRTVSFSVGGQSFTLLTMDEAIRLERVAKRKVRDLERTAKMAAGLGNRRRISTRM